MINILKSKKNLNFCSLFLTLHYAFFLFPDESKYWQCRFPPLPLQSGSRSLSFGPCSMHLEHLLLFLFCESFPLSPFLLVILSTSVRAVKPTLVLPTMMASWIKRTFTCGTGMTVGICGRAHAVVGRAPVPMVSTASEALVGTSAVVVVTVLGLTFVAELSSRSFSIPAVFLFMASCTRWFRSHSSRWVRMWTGIFGNMLESSFFAFKSALLPDPFG